MLVSISGSAKRQQARVPSALDNAQIRISRGQNPAGHWLDSDVTSLGHGELSPRAQVSETQLQLLVGMGRDRKSVMGDHRRPRRAGG